MSKIKPQKNFTYTHTHHTLPPTHPHTLRPTHPSHLHTSTHSDLNTPTHTLSPTHPYYIPSLPFAPQSLLQSFSKNTLQQYRQSLLSWRIHDSLWVRKTLTRTVSIVSGSNDGRREQRPNSKTSHSIFFAHQQHTYTLKHPSRKTKHYSPFFKIFLLTRHNNF